MSNHHSRRVMSDKKWRTFKDKCSECKRLLNEDTGECPKCHGVLGHGCQTRCCSILVGGNHKFCKYHRQKQVKSICKIQQAIMKEYNRRRYGRSAIKYNYLDSKEEQLKFTLWKVEKLGFTDMIPELEQ